MQRKPDANTEPAARSYGVFAYSGSVTNCFPNLATPVQGADLEEVAVLGTNNGVADLNFNTYTVGLT